MTDVNAHDVLTPHARAANEILQVEAVPSQIGRQITTALGESVCVPDIQDATLSILRCMALGMTRKEIAARQCRSLDFVYNRFIFTAVGRMLGVPGKQRPGIIRACYQWGLLTCNMQTDAWPSDDLCPTDRRTLQYGSSGMTINELAAAEGIGFGTACARRARLLRHLGAKNMSMAVTIGYVTGELKDIFPVKASSRSS